jgi:phenylalanyl-tRNA synthetase beta chain
VDRPAAEVAEILTSRGLTVDAVSEVAGDTVFDIDVPANRPDCLGHRGIAREVAASQDAELAPLPDLPVGTGEPVDAIARVFIDDPNLCRRFTASLIRGVRIGPSPPEVVRRLEACGLRSVSNVVDASNLVLLELGQPIHTYDLQRVEGLELRARAAVEGETLTTLDGTECRLAADMIVIADGTRAVGLGGVMGGANTEIHDGTSDVLIEAANFHPSSVRSMARRLGLNTDASHRFEPPAAQAMALRLIAELAGGVPAPGLIDVYPGRSDPSHVRLRTGRIGILLGYQPDDAIVERSLASLSLEPRRIDDGSFEITVPSWRYDLEQEADLVEEVARHLGYDRIPSSMPPLNLSPPAPERAQIVEERARDLFSHLGFHEAVNYAMIGLEEDRPFLPADAPEAWPLENPIAETLAFLRRSLIPGLVRSADFNLRRGARDVRLFEVGRVFLAPGKHGFPDEPLHAGLVWSGAPAPRHWSNDPETVEFHHVAGLVDTVLESLDPAGACTRSKVVLDGLHPGRSATWARTDRDAVVAVAGELHPDLRRRLDLAAPAYVAEIDLTSYLRLPPGKPQYRALARVPGVARDIAVVLNAATPYREVETALARVASPAAAAFEVTDRYTGPPLADDEASVTVRVMLQPQEKSLTDSQIEGYRLRLIEVLEKRLGLTIRSGD